MRLVENDIQTFTVAIADADQGRRLELERLLKGEIGIDLLSDGGTNDSDNGLASPRRKPRSRSEVTAYEKEVARIKFLKPFVLVVSLNQCNDEGYAFLLLLRHACPDARMILLIDNSIDESHIINILQIGARGYLNYENARFHLPTAIKAVGHGEAWVPRKMLGSIVKYILKK